MAKIKKIKRVRKTLSINGIKKAIDNIDKVDKNKVNIYQLGIYECTKKDFESMLIRRSGKTYKCE